MELRSYQYRLYPSQKQKNQLIDSFKICKIIYNELLALSIDSYTFGNASLNKFDYNDYLSGRGDILFSQVRQNVADRVHKAFQNFFRRVKDISCKQKGFPRFKNRVSSITYPQAGFKLLSYTRLHLSKIGNVPIVLHRIPKGKIKTLTIKQNQAGQWHAFFACEQPEVQITHPSMEKVGIDVGLESFATLSNGKTVANPHHLLQAEQRLKHLQRSMSRKKKGSKNRAKARLRLTRHHLKVQNQRSDFLHKLSRQLTQSYSLITVENLQIQNMVKNHHLAKHITDASWNTFIRMLSYKAVTSGGQIIKVNPRNTSKTCSQCGNIQDMPLSRRQYICSCGVSLHRDLNAARNILHIGQGLPESTPVEIPPLPLVAKASEIAEAGTTHGTNRNSIPLKPSNK